MGNNDCWCLLATVAGIFIGVILGLVYFFGLIPAVLTSVNALIVLAAVFLVVLILIGATAGTKVARCVCGNGNCLLAGIVGTIVVGLIATAVNLATITIANAVIIGLFGLFATLFIIAAVVFAKCIIETNCRCRD